VLQPSDDSGGASILPAALQKELAALRPQLLSVERTASQLCSLFGRLDTFTQLSTPSTACALFMLALEAEARKPLSASTALAGLLGARFGCAGTTVQGRYKAAYDIAESWTAELPWASMYKKMGSREKTARAKEGKRAVVAKSLKDAVAFQEAIWIKKVGMDKATLELEDDDNETASDSNSSAPSTVSSKRTLPGDDQMAEVAPFGYPRKRARTAQTGMDAASAFLLSPSTALATTARSSRSRLRTTTTTSEGSSLLTHLLSVDLCALSLSHPPTRLQLLGTTRDGADRVLDEELFEDGELEGMLRRPEEVDAFARTVDWPDDAPSSTKLGGASKPGPRVKAPKGRERLNMDRLTRLLGEPDTNESTDDGKNDMADAWEDFALLGGVAVLDEALVFDVDKDDDPANEPSSHLPSSTSIGMAEEDVEEWRPASPGGDGGDWCEF
jgi:transcription factor IIIB subunit 2